MSEPGFDGGHALAALAQEVRALRETVEQLTREHAGEMQALRRQVDEMTQAAERAARERGALEERLTFQLRQLKRMGPR